MGAPPNEKLRFLFRGAPPNLRGPPLFNTRLYTDLRGYPPFLLTLILISKNLSSTSKFYKINSNFHFFRLHILLGEALLFLVGEILMSYLPFVAPLLRNMIYKRKLANHGWIRHKENTSSPPASRVGLHLPSWNLVPNWVNIQFKLSNFLRCMSTTMLNSTFPYRRQWILHRKFMAPPFPRNIHFQGILWGDIIYNFKGT